MTTASPPVSVGGAADGRRRRAVVIHIGRRRSRILRPRLFAVGRSCDVCWFAGRHRQGTIDSDFHDKEALFRDLILLREGPGGVRRADTRLSGCRCRCARWRSGRSSCSCLRVTATAVATSSCSILSEGPRFPAAGGVLLDLEVLSRISAAVRALLRARSHARAAQLRALIRVPAIACRTPASRPFSGGWAVSSRHDPLDVQGLMRSHLDILFGQGEATDFRPRPRSALALASPGDGRRGASMRLPGLDRGPISSCVARTGPAGWRTSRCV